MRHSLDGGPLTPVLASKSDVSYPEFSPDGRWLAYVSDESGRSEVYVQPYPGPGPRHRVSTGGGAAPAWSRRGEMFYTVQVTPELMRMMSVPFTVTPSFAAGTPQVLFEGLYGRLQGLTRGYDVSLDGQTFYLTQRKTRPPIRVTQMVLVQNWVEELKRRVPTK